ncbi:transglutaminase [Alsobacter metallidurans]|uniref:Transglutaminase n=1 Tax=Alsobacter metallidurans TaxID=340221 RepID=A0A917I766_9HYPH|nr:transglutaminase domain-containing protein [Alsobacter metallidurans]GGH16758.1 transglutaminase [Alsobacter metallidurans]
MLRRDVLKGGLAAGTAALLPRAAWAQASAPGWRSFEIRTTLKLRNPGGGAARAWVPLPSAVDESWVRAVGSTWSGNGRFEAVADPVYGAPMLVASWTGEAEPRLEIVSRLTTRDRAVDLARPTPVTPLSETERLLYTRGTELLPVTGIVKAKADEIVAGAAGDLAKARAIYEWVVENTFRDPATLGCGVGDIESLLASGNLGGKCADLNALYVGLARAAGLPARDVYGIRIAPSRRGYRSLGANAEVISKAQHCRAEVWLADFGWFPVDPADVRKVVLEEPPGKLAITDPKVVEARKMLFGGWEMNWMPYNVAHDVTLPGSRRVVPFLMYSQAETADGVLDSLDPDAFGYAITAREVTA